MRTIMLDVDGVLVGGRPHDGAHLFTDLHRDLGVSLEDLRREFFQPRWEAIVNGQKALIPELSEVLALIAPTVTPEILAEYWFRNDSRIETAVLADVADLRRNGDRLFLATNQEHMRASYLMNEMGLARAVDGIFYSAALGYRKPAREFFALVTQRTSVEPNQIIFVDDTEANVVAAKEYGWKASHWKPGMRLTEVVAAHE